MKSRNTWKVIGVMSGTSLDGLDIACCRFVKNRKWEFDIQHAETVKYPPVWRHSLATAHLLSGEDLQGLDARYGNFVGGCCKEFIRKSGIRSVDLIASHGHTIFHQPKKQFTFQLGHGAAIHAATKLPVIYDFRSLDVALGGEGAPLVPIGDRLLFGDYDVCVNLGGIANLSMERNRRRIAFDICYANMGLNYMAGKRDLDMDRDGRIASSGEVHPGLLKRLSAVYKLMRRNRPSLSREGFELQIAPLLSDESISLENRMRTFCQSVAEEILLSMGPVRKNVEMLVTGGGGLNPVLMQMLEERLYGVARIAIPPRQIIEFKEALIFAFLGLLRMNGEVNVLKSVTHASRDSSSGLIIG